MEENWDEFMFGNTKIENVYLPESDVLVSIFGTTFNSTKDRNKIADRLRSLFWMTYRKAFPPIVVRTGPTCDAGWGCMHRCGQMMLAEAITRIRLGEDWSWFPGCQNENYAMLRRMFQDDKCALYSIQNIVMIGMALDKPIGSWFGPNTVAQVIKKLCAYDPAIDWSVHISVEDGLIIDEIKNACQKSSASRLRDVSPLILPPTSTDGLEDEWDLDAFKARFGYDVELVEPASHIHGPVTRDADEDFLEVVLPPTFDYEHIAHSPSPSASFTETPLSNQTSPAASAGPSPSQTGWRPLLLFIPLRIGVQHSNPCYFRAIKAVLRIPQSLGIMGGRPSHALWIVGVVGDGDVLCLDPHVTHPASLGDELTEEDDRTHHCETPVRLPLSRLDPSMVLGFLCPTEESFDQLCATFERDVLMTECGEPPLFEMRQTRPFNLPPMPAARTKTVSACKDLPSADVGDNDVRTSGMNIYSEQLGEAFATVRELWTKCNQAASGTVRSLANLSSPTSGSGSEFEVL